MGIGGWICTSINSNQIILSPPTGYPRSAEGCKVETGRIGLYREPQDKKTVVWGGVLEKLLRRTVGSNSGTTDSEPTRRMHDERSK